MAEPAPFLTARNISKRFGITQALDDVSVSFRRGEIHALMGENGAGKSTLGKVIAGLHRQDTGAVEISGRTLKPGTPFRFATDIEDYANWTLAHILRSPDFVFRPEQPRIWHEPYPGWEPTRYEEKARLAGRHTSFYLSFERR